MAEKLDFLARENHILRE
jgi:hypothetical protein